MRTFRTLELAIRFHQQAEPIKLPSYLKSQLLRASSSVALNLSEGNAKLSKKEKNRFYFIAFGSLRESQTILRLGRQEGTDVFKTADRLGGHLYRLTRSLL